MSANTSAFNDSDVEENVAARTGGDPLPDYVATDTGSSSITQRCRERLKWVSGEDFPGPNKDNWVCQDRNCDRPVCVAYCAYEIAASKLEQSRQELEQSRRELEQSRQELEQSRRELNQDIDGPNSQNTVIVGLRQDKVEDKQEKVEDKQDKVEDKQAIVEDKQAIVEGTKALLKEVCESLLKEHTTMKEVLINGKIAGNKTDHKTLYTNKSVIEQEVDEMDQAAAAAGNGQSQTSPSHLFNAMHDRIEEYAIPSSLNDLFKKLHIDKRDPRKKEIQAFYDYCDNCLFFSSVESEHEYMSEEYAKDIQVTVKAIVEWQQDKRISRTTKVYRPSSQAQETRGVHPILLALMWKINSILKGSAHLTSEQYLPKQLEKSKRWMDALWSKAAQHFLSRANGNLIDKSCEFKPLSRKNDEYMKMVKDGLSQELGHNLQVLWDSCYQFCGGLGKDGETSGIVLTMVSASLLGSKLSGVGTKTVELKISRRENMPLFSEKTTQNLAKGEGFKFESLGLKFSPNVPMQPGFIALIDFISNDGGNTPQNPTEVSLDFSSTTISVDSIGYLGSGAFCSVYECTLSDKNRTVLKMSKDWDSTTLQTELEALQALSQEPSHEAIPKLFHDKLVKVMVKAHCEQKQAKGLLLDVAIGESLQQKPQHVRIQDVHSTMENVLAYAHRKGWFHLDLQPANILLVVNADGTHRYILIDWGMAVKKGKRKLKSFRGSPPFSHPDMLLVKKKTTDTWCGPQPKAEFDRFSLAMTLAYIEHKGVPWCGFHSKVVTNYMLENRHKKAVQLISTSSLDNAVKRRVLQWIPGPTKQSPSSQPQTPKGKSTKRGQGKKRKSNTEH